MPTWMDFGLKNPPKSALGRLLGRLVAVLGRLGALWGASWAVLGGLGSLLGRLGASESRKDEKDKNLEKPKENR